MEKKQQEQKIWKRVCRLVFPYKRYFPWIFVCLLGTSFLTFLQPLVIRRITDEGMMQKDMECIVVFSGLLFLMAIVTQLIALAQTRLFVGVHNGLNLSLYKKAYQKIERLPVSYYDEKGSAEIVNTLSADIGNVASVADQITSFSVDSILRIVGGVVGLALLDWKLALLIVFLIPVKYLVVRGFAKKKNQAFELMLERNRKFFAWVGDCINGVREMKLWDLFRVRNRAFEELQQKMMDSHKENMLLDQYRTLCTSGLDMLLNASLYILSGAMIVKGEFTIGGAFAFISYSSYVISPISFLVNVKYYFAQIKPSAKRFFSFLDQPEEGSCTEEVIVSAGGTRPRTGDAPVLELSHVRFGYEKEKPILKDINLTVHPGDKIGIIGENGSGKSTLINLILGFYQPDCGTIKLDGNLLNKNNIRQARKRIGVVSQKPYLFQGTIEENINVDGTASREEVIEACKKSGAIIFIEKLEMGFGQMIGLDGAKLSGGEKQKIAVARALLRDADILLMDEATSGFDAESDRSFTRLLAEEFADKTVLFITHRYEELEGVHKVYRLTDGALQLQRKA